MSATPLPQTSHPCFPQPDDPSASVWRYMDFAKFTSLLGQQRIHLARLDQLGDPHEGSLRFPNYEANRHYWESQGRPDIAQLTAKSNLALREVTYVSCWMLRSSESEAMWRLYCGPNQGIAIQTSYERLAQFATGHNMFIGKVNYIDFDKTPIPVGNAFYAPMHKRLAFEHESEVRIVQVLLEEMTTYLNGVEYRKNPPASAHLDLDLDLLLEGVYVHPYAPDWFESSVRLVVRSLAPGLENRLHWSRMKSAPLY